MRVRLLYLWDSLRNRVWFIPTLFAMLGLLLAITTLEIDRQFDLGTDELLPGLRTTGASARTVLGALISALVTVTGLAFSIMMTSVAQTSSQFGPRLIRNVFDSNIVQFTLGIFVATVVFSMVVLRSIREIEPDGEIFTPNLSIMLAEIAGAGCMVSLLAFTNHMTSCLRAETLIASISRKLYSTADKLARQVEQHSDRSKSDWQPLPSSAGNLRLDGEGYLQAIDIGGLRETASRLRHRIELGCRPGDYVYRGSTVARIALSDGNDTQPLDARLLRESYGGKFLLGTVRTIRQDLEAGVHELVESAVRALSPGVNDPYTAINVIDTLSSFVGYLAQQKWPSEIIIDQDDQPIIRRSMIDFQGILDVGFNQLRQHAGNSVAVHCRLLEGLRNIAEQATDADQIAAIRTHTQQILRHAAEVTSDPDDLKDIQDRGSAAEAVLDRWV